MASTTVEQDNTQNIAEMPATASYVLTVGLLAWIFAEAKRLGVSKSEVVRQILDGARRQEQAAA